MQYESYKKKSNAPLYIIIAVCVIAIGIVAYLASIKSNEKEQNNSSSSGKSEISSDNSSYNGSTEEKTENNSSMPESMPDQTSKITENSVSSVPYEEKQTFVMPVKGNIIKGYSDTSLQYDKTYGDLRMHSGIDISCEQNAKIVSASKGTVTDISDSANYGTVITIDHGKGLTVKYCGLGSACVTKGETVNTGDLIGTQKNPACECMDENHIHIECMINGNSESPVKAFGFQN